MTGTVLVERSGARTTVTLNRPEQLNAFTCEMHRALRPELEAARDDESCRVIVLTGAGRGFCAGQDLGDKEAAGDLDGVLARYYSPLVKLLRECPKPVIAAVNGVAAGAGVSVALACDIVVAKRSAKFIQAFAKIGLIPDAGGTWTVTQLVGEARAKAMMLTGAPVSADEAERIGLIAKCVDDEAFDTSVDELASGFEHAATFGLGLTKQAVHAAAGNSLDRQLDYERELQLRASQSPDFREGVNAFMEKRAPKFSGRARG